MKKRVCMLGVVLVLFLGFFACFGTEKVTATENIIKKSGEFLYKILEENDTVSFMGYTGNAEELIIPSEIEGKKVTEIGGMYAEERQDWWNSSSVTTVKTITIPATIESMEYLGIKYDGAEKVIFEDGTTRICADALGGWDNLKEVVLPDTVTTIGEDAFAVCKALTTINIPKGLKTIEGGVFEGCKKLKKIAIPKDTKLVGENILKGTKWMAKKRAKNPLVVVNGTLIDAKTVKGVVTIPKSVKNISDMAYWGNKKVTKIVIPHSVKTIGKEAFYECKKLASIRVPKSVKSIGENAFGETKWLAKQKKKNRFVTVNNMLITTAKLNGKVVIPSNIKGIVGFSGGKKLKSVTIPKRVKWIGENAFDGCMAKEITLSEGLEEIQSSAFSEAYVEKLVFPASLKKIGSYAFGEYSSLREVTFKAPVELEEYAFANATDLKNVELPDGMTIVPKGTFYGCLDLENVIVPASVNEIGIRAFYTYDPEASQTVLDACYTDVMILNPDCKIQDVKNLIYKGMIWGIKNSTVMSYAEKYEKVVVIKGATSVENKIQISWESVKNAEGYEVEYSTTENFENVQTLNIQNGSVTSAEISDIEPGKEYYVRVCAYRDITVNAEKQTVYTGWSSVNKL